MITILLDDIIMFLLEQELQSSVTDGPHGVVGHRRDEDSEQLVGTRLDCQAFVVLGTREYLRHRVLALKYYNYLIYIN